MNLKWDLRFLELAKLVSTWSKDPSTKTGAVIVRPDKTVVSIGFNGFPKGMSDSEADYANRELKYKKIVHCEMNALIHAGGSVRGCTLYTYPFACCERCVVHIIQAGIIRFVYPKSPADQLSRWQDAFIKTHEFLTEAKVDFDEIVYDVTTEPHILHNWITTEL
jgi:dCMP deaminase